MAARTAYALHVVLLVQRFGLVRRHVHAGRAVRRAALAGQAQVERLGDRRVREPLHQRPVDRLLEHPGATPGGVLLVAGGEVRRAHHSGGRRRDALADAGAAVHRVAKPATVVRELQQRQHRLAGPHRPEVGVQRRRVDHVAGVEQVARVADRLDRGEQPDRLLVVHQREQLGARPAVAVLTGERAVVVAQLERAGGEEVAEDLRRADLARLEREVDPHVHAAVAEMAVGHAVEAVPLQQLVEVAQPGAQPVRRDRGVLPAGVRRALQAAGGEAGAVLADPPERGRLGGVGHQPVPEGAALRDHDRGQRRSFGADELHEEPAVAVRQLRYRAAPRPDQVDDPRVQPLAGDHGAVGGCEQRRHRVGRLDHRRVAEHHQEPLGLVLDQPHGGLPDQRERAFRAGQEPVDARPFSGSRCSRE